MQGNSLSFCRQSSEQFRATSQQLSELHKTGDYNLNGQPSVSSVSYMYNTYIAFIVIFIKCPSSSAFVALVVKDHTTEAPALQPPITLNAEQQFDAAEFNRSGRKNLAVEDRDRASPNSDVTLISSTSAPALEVRTRWISSTCSSFISSKILFLDLLKCNLITVINKPFILSSDCFSCARRFGGGCSAQSRRLFAPGTEEEEQGAWKGKAGTQMCKPTIGGFVPDGNADPTYFT